MADKKESGNVAAKGGAAADAPAADKKVSDAKPAASGKDSKKGSFKFVLSYARRECCSIIFGLIFLVGGSTADLAVPYFIGRIIDAINKGEYDKIGDICI